MIKNPIISGIIAIFFGGVFMVTGLYFSYEEYQIRATGTKVTGSVTKIITVEDGEDETYAPKIRYQFDGEEQFYVPSSSSSINNFQVGDSVDIFVSDRGIRIKSRWLDIIMSIVSFFFGLAIIVLIVNRFKKRTKKAKKIVYLKRYGEKTSARYIRSTNAEAHVNDQRGLILFVQEIDGDRVFKTTPIFSNFSRLWLEEEIFDVYIDSRNPDNYFVDVEKDFRGLRED